MSTLDVFKEGYLLSGLSIPRVEAVKKSILKKDWNAARPANKSDGALANNAIKLAITPPMVCITPTIATLCPCLRLINSVSRISDD